MLIALASIIIALVLAFDGNMKIKKVNGGNTATNKKLSENFYTTGILLGLALLVVVVSLLLSFVGVGNTRIGRGGVATVGVLGTIVGIVLYLLILGALVFAWLTYVNAAGTVYAVQALVMALALTAGLALTLSKKNEGLTIRFD
jgi:hypothetical protein